MSASDKVQTLAEEYQKLSDTERHSFAELVAPIDRSELSEKWSSEIHRRAADIDSQRVNLINGEDFMKRLQGT